MGYDGVYRGEVTLTRGAESLCGKSSYRVAFTVLNGQFSMMYSGSQQYVVHMSQYQVIASGHIVGNVLDAHIEGAACGRSYHLTKG